MLSQKIVEKAKTVGLNIKKNQDLFLEIVGESLVELGGSEWRVGEVTLLFRNTDKELATIMCDAKDGPQIERHVYKRFFLAAKKTLLFGVSFKMTQNLSYEDLEKVKDMMAADQRQLSPDDKFKDCRAALKFDKRKLKAKSGLYWRIERPAKDNSDADKWMANLLDALSTIFSSAEVQSLLAAANVTEKAKVMQLAKIVGTKTEQHVESADIGVVRTDSFTHVDISDQMSMVGIWPASMQSLVTLAN